MRVVCLKATVARERSAYQLETGLVAHNDETVAAALDDLDGGSVVGDFARAVLAAGRSGLGGNLESVS